jgi:hypothetical protein
MTDHSLERTDRKKIQRGDTEPDYDEHGRTREAFSASSSEDGRRKIYSNPLRGGQPEG